MSRRLRALVLPIAAATLAAAAGAAEITPPASAVTASTHDGNVPGNVVDNSLGTRWSANGDGQWLQLDLGVVQPVASVSVAVYNGNLRRNRFELQLSSGGGTWTTVFSGESSGTTTAEQAYDFADQDARYVRYLGHGSSDPTKATMNSVTEVSVEGGVVVVTPTPTPTPTGVPPTPTPTPGTEVVKLTPAGASASTNDGNVPANAVDGSLATRWSANGDGAWLQVDLGATQSVSRVRIAVYNGNSRRNRFDLQTSSVAGVWDDVFTGAQTSGTTTQLESYDFAARPARWVRYVGHMSNVGTFNSLTEVEVWGAACTSCPTPVPTLTPTPTATPVATPTPTPTPRVSGTVYFQDTGTKAGWPNYPQNPQNLGRLDEVGSPVYKGSTALRFEQTYVDNATERYHTEVTYHGSQQNGQERYYGFTMMLPTTWHNESVKDNFTQWGAESPGGPWLLMWIDQDHIKGGHPNTFGTTDFGAITKGVWHRIVFRLRMVNGSPFEVWVDGTRRGAPTCSCGSTSSVRWSAGIYVSYWYDRYRTGLPSGSQRTRFLYQDHYRIASTYAAADPAGW